MIVRGSLPWLASAILAIDGFSRGLLGAVSPSLVRWSEGLFVENADRLVIERQVILARSVGTRPASETSSDPRHPISCTSDRGSSPPPAGLILGAQIGAILQANDIVLVGNPQGLILDIGVGAPPQHQWVSQEVWERLIAEGVALIPWWEVVRLRMAMCSGPGGRA